MPGDRRTGKRFLLLVLVGGALLPLLLFYAFPWPRSSGARGNRLKLIHKEQQYFPSNGTTTVFFMEQQAPPTTPSVQSALADHVWRTCGKDDSVVEEPVKLDYNYYKHVLVDDRYKVLYCYVPKVACTNWRRVLLALSGKVKVSNIMDISAVDAHHKYKPLIRSLGDFSRSEINYRLDNYYKFMFVREPFERLLSAWRNKFQSNTASSLTFRKTFVHSIQRLLKGMEQDRGLAAAQHNKVTVPFDKFLQYLVHPDRREELNEHWDKFHGLCHPCSIQYDFIGKYETIDQDADHVLKSVHADHVVSFPKRSTNYRHNRTSTYLKDYFRDLPPSLLQRVYDMYRLDFKLFDYSVPEELQGLFDAEHLDGIR